MNTCPNCGKVAGLHSSILQGCMCQYSMQVPPQRTEQEPVAFWNFNSGFSHCMIDQLNEAAKKNPAPLYTTPPQRTWVGLTDDEMYEAVRPLCKADSVARSLFDISKDEYRAIEAKLKELNT